MTKEQLRLLLEKGKVGNINKEILLTGPQKDQWTCEPVKTQNDKRKGHPVMDSYKTGFEMPIAFLSVETKIILRQRIPGLNGDDGLLREHWSKRDKRKEFIKNEIVAQKPNKHPGQVKLQFIGYSSHLMDWDNHCSRLKICGDAMKDLGIITDDSPKYIVEFVPTQVKVKTKEEERIEIIITNKF
jgi:Holliday junction resolvase RusA-like endonuclease